MNRVLKTGIAVAFVSLIGAVLVGPLGATAQDVPSFAYEQPAKVIGIADGDTFDVRWPDGTVETIRPAGVDTPEVDEDECFADEATQFTEEMLLGRTVWLSEVPDGPRGPFDRLLARVHLDSTESTSFNKILVSQGYAVADEEFPVGRELQPLEDEAREADRGIWGPPCDRDGNGDGDGPPTDTVLIHSMMPNPPGDERYEGTEWIKVVNAGDADADISGWTIDDGEGSETFPSGTVLAPGETAQVESCLNPFDLCLANSGDEVALKDMTGSVADRCSYTESEATTDTVIDCLKDN